MRESVWFSKPRPRAKRDRTGSPVNKSRVKCSKSILDYVEHIKRLGWKNNTIDSAYMAIKRVCNDLEVNDKPVHSINERKLDDYYHSRTDLKLSSLYKTMFHVGRWLDYCVTQNYCDRNYNEGVRIRHAAFPISAHDKRPKNVIEDADYYKLLEFINSDKVRWIYGDQTFWNFAVILSRRTGMRLSDVCLVRWESFKEPGKIIYIQQKTGRRCEHPHVHHEICDALLTVPRTDDIFMFPKMCLFYGDRLRQCMLSWQFARLVIESRINRTSFHCLRHTYITEQLSMGRSIEEVQYLVGHQSQKTTWRYVHAENARAANKVTHSNWVEPASTADGKDVTSVNVNEHSPYSFGMAWA